MGVLRGVGLTASLTVMAFGASGCGGSVDPVPSSSASAAAEDAAESDLTWPEGASADTPRCVTASDAVVAAVNATIVRSREGEPSALDGLRAHADPEAAVWILTGHLSAGVGASVEVAWATTADPTAPDFSGDLRSVGSAAAAISSAPVLSLPSDDDLDGDGIPPEACH